MAPTHKDKINRGISRHSFFAHQPKVYKHNIMSMGKTALCLRFTDEPISFHRQEVGGADRANTSRNLDRKARHQWPVSGKDCIANA